MTDDLKIRRMPALSNTVQTFPRATYALLTPAVATASEEHDDARRRLADAERQAATLHAAVDAAHAADEQAAREAVLAGKAPPPRSAPKTSEAADRGDRAAAASHELARESQAALVAAVVADLGELHAAIDARRTALAGSLEADVERVAVGLRAAGRLDELRDALDAETLGHARNPQLQPVRHRRRPHDASEGPLAALRAALGAREGHRFSADEAA